MSAREPAHHRHNGDDIFRGNLRGSLRLGKAPDGTLEHEARLAVARRCNAQRCFKDRAWARWPAAAGSGAGCLTWLDVGHRCATTALRDQRASTRLTLAALGGHAEFELDVVKAHARACTTGDAVFADAVADANNHGWAVEITKGMRMNMVRI